MRTLYGSTSWKRVLALVLVFVMMVSTMGTSGYSVFAEDLVETNEEVIVSEPEANVPEVTEDIQGPSPGEEESEAVVDPATDAEPVEASEDSEEPAADSELVETSEEGEEPAEEVAEPVEATEEGEEPADAEPVEETEEGEEPADAETVEETEEAEPVEPAEETLISEAAKVIEGDDGAEAPEEEVVEAVEEAIEELPEGTTSFEPVKFDDAIVMITADPYTFPDDTTVVVEEVPIGRTVLKAIDGVVNAVPIKAYDITFFDASGTDIQPAKPVKISIESIDLPEVDNLQILHIDDNGRKADIVEGVEETESGFEFDAAHFSIYVIMDGENQTFRRTYKFEDINVNGEYVSYEFYNKAGEKVDNQIIKNGDELEPVGTPYHAGFNFVGWYLLDGTELNEAVEFESAINDVDADETVTVRAKYDGVYYLYFHENDYTTSLNEDIILTTYVVPEGKSYPINDIKAPIPGAGYLFIGWAIGSSNDEGCLDSPYTPEDNTDLYPVFTPGHWLRFVGNGTGASYTEAISVSTITDLSTVTKPADPTRAGYKFAGWFNAADGEDEFSWNGTLKEDKFVYAHWTPLEADYSVFYWVQNADDDNYTFLTSKTLTGTAGANTAAGELSSSEMAQFSNIAWEGFVYQEPTQQPINGEGSTVVNVFYDRKIVSLTFHRQTNTTYDEDPDGLYYKVNRVNGNRNYYYKSGSGDADYTNIDTAIGNNRYFKYRSEGPLATVGSGDTIPLYTREIVGFDWDDLDWIYRYELSNREATITRYSISGLQPIVLAAKYGQDIHAEWPENPEETTAWYLTPSGGNTYVTMLTTMPVSDRDYYYRPSEGSSNLETVFLTQDLDNLSNFSVYTTAVSKGGDGTYTTADDYSGITGFSINAYDENDAAEIRNTHGGDPNATYNTDYNRSPRIGTEFNEGTHSGNTYTLNFYYLRNQYDIDFISNGKVVKSVEDVYYGADIKNKVPTDYVIDETEEVVAGANCVFQGWYDNEDCEGNPYSFNTMPAGNLTLYAKWEKAWYIVTIDPNGGVLNGGIPGAYGDSTWFWRQYGSTFSEYVTTRDYVADPNGEYYYHYRVDFDDESEKRLAYYTTDATLSTDGGNTYRHEPGAYVFEGWYVLDKDGDPADTPYDFQTIVSHSFTLQAQWRKAGKYTVAYQGTVTLEDGTTVNGNAAQDDTFYADKAEISLPAAPSNITAMYVFDGWTVVDASGNVLDDNDGKFYQPGGKLTLDADEWADSSKVIHIQAHYTKVDESSDPVGITKLVLNANGGVTSITKGTFVDANGKIDPIDVVNNVVTYSNLPLNQHFVLAEVNDKFTKDGYELKGWNHDKNAADAGEVEYGVDKVYTLGVDNEDPAANTLYAVWEKAVTYTVTYTDGVTDEVVFRDQVTEVASGADTPKFTGSLDRENYVFAGWDPEVAETVTKTVIYTATWKDDKNNNDVADVDELFYDANGGEGDAYTTVGTKEEGATAFTVTVADNQYTRAEYTFTGWNTKKDGNGEPVEVGSTYTLDPDAVDTVYAQWTAKETPAVTYTILYNSNYSTYSSLTDIEKLDGPATSLTILSPDDAKLGFAEKVDSDPIWTNGEQKFKFIGWSLQSAKGSAIYEGTTYPETATTPAGQDDAGNATITDQQPMNPRPDGTSSLATRVVLRTLAMAVTSSEGDTADLTLYAQWEEVVKPVEPNPHLTVKKEVTSTPPNGTAYAAGETITYTITVTNDGNVDIEGITVTDELTGNVGEKAWTIKTLPVGESETFTATYTVTQADAAAGSVKNTATAKAPDPSVEPEDPDDPVVPDVPVDPGETITPTTNPGGGGNDNPRPRPNPDPTDEPEEPIDDPDTPLAPPEEEDTEIDDGDTPLAPGTIDDETEIDEEATPLSPFTGDDRHTDVWAFLSVLSLAGIVLLGRKRREEE